MFHLFAFNQYYPSGGVNDYQGQFDSVEEALDEVKNSSWYKYQIVNSDFTIEQTGWVEDL